MTAFRLLSRTRQVTEYSCGACALEAVLGYWGRDVEEAELMRLMGTNDQVGTWPDNMVRGVRALGFEAEVRERLTLDEVRAFTDQGHPLIVVGQFWISHRESGEDVDLRREWNNGHYVVVLGVDDEYVYFQDPYLRMGKAFIPRAAFERRWHQVMGGKESGNRELLRLGIFVRGERPAVQANVAATVRDLDFTRLGSFNLIVNRFPGRLLPFDLYDSLRTLWPMETVRPVAFVLVCKDAEGTIGAMEGGTLEDTEDAIEINALLAAITARSVGRPPATVRADMERAMQSAAQGDFGVSAADIRAIATRLPPDHTAIVVLFENTWERRFREIVHAHGGEITNQRMMGPEEISAKLREVLAG